MSDSKNGKAAERGTLVLTLREQGASAVIKFSHTCPDGTLIEKTVDVMLTKSVKGQARVAFQAPKDVKIVRSELLKKSGGWTQ